MLTTAKSIQLLDASGMNISPITDITSLYYETPTPNNSSIITRKYVYTGFPVAVNINGENQSSIGIAAIGTKRDLSLYNNGQFYKVIDSDKNEDILVSRLDTSIIPGTTLRQIEVKNYNLSKILSYYTPLDLMDASYGELIDDISIINSSIDDISNRISNLRESLDMIGEPLSKIIEWRTYNVLVPNKFYLINDYYADSGCMALPKSRDFSGPSTPLSLLIKANDASTLDGKLYEMYDHNGNALKVYGTYKLEEDNKVRITYMKDQYGNEAPYDFYNLKYNKKYTFGTNSINSSIQNNIIKTDPYTFGSMPYIDNKLKLITNNYIGYDTSL